MEQRKTSRVGPFVTSCGVRAEGVRLSAYVLDLSPMGAQLSSEDTPPAPGAIVRLVLKLSGRRQPLELGADVRWVQAPVDDLRGIYHFGVRFEEMSEEATVALTEVLEGIRKRAAMLDTAEGEEPVAETQNTGRRLPWHKGPTPSEPGWLSLSDDDLLFEIESLGAEHDKDPDLLAVVRSGRHFFVRQEAAKKVTDKRQLKEHAGDRHIGQILVRGMNRSEDVAYLEQIMAESRHLEVRKAAEVQLRLLKDQS